MAKLKVDKYFNDPIAKKTCVDANFTSSFKDDIEKMVAWYEKVKKIRNFSDENKNLVKFAKEGGFWFEFKRTPWDEMGALFAEKADIVLAAINAYREAEKKDIERRLLEKGASPTAFRNASAKSSQAKKK